MWFWRRSVLLAIALTGLGPAMPASAADSVWGSSTAKKSSWTDSISSTFKSMGDALKPKSTPAATESYDPTALKNKANAGPDLRVTMAQAYERQGNLADAERQYQLAMKESPKDVKVICAFARLRVRQGQSAEALKLYQQALKIAPDQPFVLNELALCYARQQQWNDALQTWHRCVQLEPNNPLYRNNLAAAMVEAGQLDAAMVQLRAVHKEAVAHYNLGYLLAKKGQQPSAAQHFRVALERDPSLAQARYWLQRLEATSREGADPQLADRPARQAESRPAQVVVREPSRSELTPAERFAESRPPTSPGQAGVSPAPEPPVQLNWLPEVGRPDSQTAGGLPGEHAVRTPSTGRDTPFPAGRPAEASAPIPNSAFSDRSRFEPASSAPSPVPKAREEARVASRVRPLPPIQPLAAAPAEGQKSGDEGRKPVKPVPVVIPLPPVE